MRYSICITTVSLLMCGSTIAQENASCDAACPVPCYFGSCAPADAGYKRALGSCDVRALDLIAELYRGTRSAGEAASAADILRSNGYGSVGRIGVTPNQTTGTSGLANCTSLIEDNTGPCAAVASRPGYRCAVENGVAVLVPEDNFVSRDAFGISGDKWTSGTLGSAGSMFREFPDAPEMVVIPSGSFLMGSPASEEGRGSDEGPQRRVTVPRAFALGRYETTFAKWDACSAAGYCRSIRSGSEISDSDQGWGRGSRPVITVSWDDTRRFIDWLNSRVNGSPYRLPSEAEWEYGARAGTTTPFSTGQSISMDNANFAFESDEVVILRGKTVPVGSFRANGFGLYDVHGNAWEWVEDCYVQSLPSDISARSQPDCDLRVLRGGSWSLDPRSLRSAYRDGSAPGFRDNNTGFRVARTLTP